METSRAPCVCVFTPDYETRLLLNKAIDMTDTFPGTVASCNHLFLYPNSIALILKHIHHGNFTLIMDMFGHVSYAQNIMLSQQRERAYDLA